MRLLVITLAAALALGSPLAAQTPTPGPAAPAAFDAVARKAAVDGAAKLLRDRYIFPEVGAKAAERLEAQLAAGAYEGLATPQAFAGQLTADIAGVAHDKHIRVSYQAPPAPRPASATAPAGPPAGKVL